MTPIAADDPHFRHRTERINGIDLHFVEAGTGPAVLLCHGWPETWYAWRHQMRALADAGYRAIAADMRGFGGTSAPAEVEAYALLNSVGDMVHLLNHLGIESTAIAGHDWGSPVAWTASLLRPDRFHAVVGLGVPYLPRGPKSFTRAIRDAGAHDNFVLYFQDPGIAEQELERDVESTLRRFYYSAAGGHSYGRRWSPSIPAGGGFLDTLFNPTGPLTWISDSELAVFVDSYRTSGFRGGLNWYRNLDRNWELAAALSGAKITQPALFIGGEYDAFLNAPWVAGAVERMSKFMPNLEAPVLLSCGHWINQERPDAVNALMIGFLGKITNNKLSKEQHGSPN